MTATQSKTLLPIAHEPAQSPLVSVLGRLCVRLGIQKKNVWAVAAVIIYLVTVLVISHYHEVWRDEGRVYSIAAEATSLRDLFYRLNDDQTFERQLVESS
jgi:hypothetical protein